MGIDDARSGQDADKLAPKIATTTDPGPEPEAPESRVDLAQLVRWYDEFAWTTTDERD